MTRRHARIPCRSPPLRCFEGGKLVVEPSGACALAAALVGRVAVEGTRVGIVLSGGNVDAQTFATLLG
jgi:threonine dehydratase